MTLEHEGARIRVVGADPALFGLLEEWLGAHGCALVEEAPDLIVVDLPSPRHGAGEMVKRLALRHRGTPIVALSASVFARVEANGAVARALGVDAVLPKPLTREALIGALQSFLPQLE